MHTKTHHIFYAFLLLGAFLFAASSVSALWQGPTQTPPGGNVSAPVNVGNNAQIKEGDLTLNASNYFANGLLVPYGKVGIGTTSPDGTLGISSGNCYYSFKNDGFHSNCIETWDYDLTIAADTANYNIATTIGKPPSSKKIRVTINSGVTVYSTSVSQPALDTGTLPAGSTVIVINNGSIIGSGGKGGTGPIRPNSCSAGTPGSSGGNAVNVQVPVTVDNTNGYIFGGGGGGGGASPYIYDQDNAPGGGGGAGLLGGPGGSGNPDGTSGGTTGGAGGAYPPTYYCPWMYGGGGGEYGMPGKVAISSFCHICWPHSNGGAAGKAVKLNGNSITWLGGNDATRVKGAVN